MSNNSRQSKFNTNTRKSNQEPARRTQQQAWTGARASPTFSPPNSAAPRSGDNTPRAPPSNNFPPLAAVNGTRSEDRHLQALSGLTGTTVTISTKTAQRYEGVVGSTSNEGDTTGVTLKDVKELTSPGAPLKDQLFIASTNIEQWSSGPADAKLTAANGDSFRTDTDISRKGPAIRERTLEAWKPDDDGVPLESAPTRGDDLTFGTGSNDKKNWDQFSANEQLFGVTATFNEDVYTTKLDRSGPDFKERERKAEKLANEILGTAANNPHIAEERGQKVEDDGTNEEDKYSTIVRSNNAYVPPGARKPGVALPASKVETPSIAIDGKPQTSSPSSQATSPAPTNKAPADAVPAFRDFVTNEKQRFIQKRQAVQKSEMDKRMAELVKFSQSFKLNKPIPDDLVPILAKDEEKRRQIKDKADKDANSGQARSIGPSASTGAVVNARAPNVPKVEATRKPNAPQPKPVISNTPAKVAAAAGKAVVDPKKTIPMVIQAIPPFRGIGDKPKPAASPATNGATPTSARPSVNAKQAAVAAANASAAANNRLNVNASSFRPNPGAKVFSPTPPHPGPASGSSSASPKPKDAQVSTPHPFFGTRLPRKNAPVNVKEDFNPFKGNKSVPEASTVGAMWPYQGKRYAQMFPAPQHPPPQQHGVHMSQPGPPMPIPPPSYEEDSAAQAAASRQPGGYVYYPPYAYPAQPMMPGMAPPPPGFMPGPYMQPMPYPAMYAPPGMQMAPPHQYMPPPPPGSYPAPPNGAGGRPSMPPTPIPAHAHPYYHHSPQLGHAVPYPMMMPPPNAGPPHQYDPNQAPPAAMGGHA